MKTAASISRNPELLDHIFSTLDKYVILKNYPRKSYRKDTVKDEEGRKRSWEEHGSWMGGRVEKWMEEKMNLISMFS